MPQKFPPKRLPKGSIKFSVKQLLIFGLVFAVIGSYFLLRSYAAPANCGRTFYTDYASGVDSNNGTSKSTPWKRAPGMVGFTGSYTHQAHDCFIFKGGVTWPNAVFPLTTVGGGDATGSDYYGPDNTWYAGSSWSRPIWDGGGTAIAGSKKSFFVSNDDYITLDNIELTGYYARNCTFGGCAMVYWVGVTKQVADHMYIHNFNVRDEVSDTNFIMFQSATYQRDDNTLQNSVIEGDPQSYAEVSRAVNTVKNNVMHDVIGMIFPNGGGEISGNLLYNCGSPNFPTGGTNHHADAIQVNPPNYNSTPAQTFYIHDNVIHDTGRDGNGNECETMLVGNPGETDYIWNNVIYNVHGNAVALTQDSSAGGPPTAAYIWNNTITGGFDASSTCVRMVGGTSQTIKVQNNYCVTNGSFSSGLSATSLSTDHNVTRTTAQASSDSYTSAQTYAYSPSASSGPSVDVGVSLSSNCSGVLATLCSDTSYGATLGANNTATAAPRTVNARPQGSVWDVGAYEYSGGGGGGSSGSWYVDPNATGSGNGTSWANAWTSFAAISWASVQPGDTIYIDGGASGSSKTYNSTLTVNDSGTASQPIKIAIDAANASHNGTATFDFNSDGNASTRTAININGSYITIDGNVGGGNHIKCTNIVNTSSGTSGLCVNGNSHTGLTVNHLQATNVNNGVKNTSTSGTVVQNSSFQQIRGDAVIALAGSTGGFDSSTVAGNYIETVCQQTGTCNNGSGNGGPDGIQNGSGVSIHDNTFKEIVMNITTSGQHPDMIQNQGDFTKVYNNEFQNMGDSNFDFDGFADATPNDIWIYNNLFRIVTNIDPYPDFIRLYSSGSNITSITNFKIMNNLFVDASNGGGIPPVNLCYYGGCAANSSGSGSQVTNNIFINDGDGTPAGAMLYLNSTAGSGWTANNNVYYRSSGAYIYWKGTTYTAANFVASIDTAGKITAPSFASYSAMSASNDFHLASSDNTAKDKGASLSSYFTIDKDGTNRPQGTAWDIGPYESASSGGHNPGDLNNDNTVNVIDLSILLSYWHTSNSNADINTDGVVNVTDLSILLSYWG